MINSASFGRIKPGHLFQYAGWIRRRANLACVYAWSLQSQHHTSVETKLLLINVIKDIFCTVFHFPSYDCKQVLCNLSSEMSNGCVHVARCHMNKWINHQHKPFCLSFSLPPPIHLPPSLSLFQRVFSNYVVRQCLQKQAHFNLFAHLAVISLSNLWPPPPTVPSCSETEMHTLLILQPPTPCPNSTHTYTYKHTDTHQWYSSHSRLSSLLRFT